MRDVTLIRACGGKRRVDLHRGRDLEGLAGVADTRRGRMAH